MPGSVAENILAGIPSLPQQQPSSIATGASRSAVLVKEGSDDAEDVARQIEAAARAADAHGFITALPKGYKTPVSNSTLSGGQKQRLCIARAIVAKRPCLLFDEATSALDSASEKAVTAAIDRLLASLTAVTSITVAHRLSTIRHSDKIVVLERGRLVESGSHDELLAKGVDASLYAKLWHIQYSRAESAGGSSASTSSIKSAVGRSVVAHEDTTAPTDGAAVPSAAANFTSSGSSSVVSSPAHGGASVTATTNTKVDLSGGSSTTASTTDVSPSAKADESAPSSQSLTGWIPLTKVPYKRAWQLQKPETGWVVAAIVTASANGLLLPIFSVLITKVRDT